MDQAKFVALAQQMSAKATQTQNQYASGGAGGSQQNQQDQQQILQQQQSLLQQQQAAQQQQHQAQQAQQQQQLDSANGGVDPSLAASSNGSGNGQNIPHLNPADAPKPNAEARRDGNSRSPKRDGKNPKDENAAGRKGGDAGKK